MCLGDSSPLSQLCMCICWHTYIYIFTYIYIHIYTYIYIYIRVLMHVGACWCMLIYVDICWYMLIYVDICWYMLIYVDIGVGDRICDMICSCISWSIHVFDSLFIHTLIHGGSFFRPLFMHGYSTYIHIYTYIIIYCYIIFMYRVVSSSTSIPT